MSMRHCAFVLVLAAVCLPAHADIYECVDEHGNKRFTNIAAEAKGCKVLNVSTVTPAPPAPAGAPSASPRSQRAPVASPSNFPRVDRELQRQRDNDRLRILEQELSSEERLLSQARTELAQQESVRLGSERNYQRTLDRLEPFQKKIKLHEDNIANLRREISKVR